MVQEGILHPNGRKADDLIVDLGHQDPLAFGVFVEVVQMKAIFGHPVECALADVFV